MLSEFPGLVPTELAAAYSIQDAVVAELGATVPGWKVGVIHPEFRTEYPSERFAGPVSSTALMTAVEGLPAKAAIFEGGIAIVEAELVVRMAHDLPPRSSRYTPDDVRGAVGDTYIAIEVVNSPLSTLARLGPGALIADHGGNQALVLGQQILFPHEPDLREVILRVNGQPRAEGVVNKAQGCDALLFLANHLSGRGHGLKAGQVVATGSIAAIHEVAPGMILRAEFGQIGSVEVELQKVVE
ncbi:MAG: 2-keto-4-pentenoate hydratase [Rhizobiaceae bacterium]